MNMPSEDSPYKHQIKAQTKQEAQPGGEYDDGVQEDEEEYEEASSISSKGSNKKSKSKSSNSD